MESNNISGQGSQIVGMGKELHDNFAIVKEILLKADDKLKFKLSKIILEGPEDDLNYEYPASNISSEPVNLRGTEKRDKY